jgi:hypothetical protein
MWIEVFGELSMPRIIERVTTPFAGCSVDRENGVLRGVKLCGLTSANGRDYPPDVFRRHIAKYDNAPVYADHGRGERSIEDKFAWIRNPRVDSDGTPRGDVHLLKSHKLFGQVIEAATRNPSLYGFSHVADCKVGKGSNGRERIESIETVVSVDLVAEPATTRGFFESRAKGDRKVKLTEYAEALAGRATGRRQRLLREVAADYPDEMVDNVHDLPKPGEVEEREATRQALETAGLGVWRLVVAGLLDSEKGLARLRKLAGLARELMANPGRDDDDEYEEESRRPANSDEFLRSIREGRRRLKGGTVAEFMASIRRR